MNKAAYFSAFDALCSRINTCSAAPAPASASASAPAPCDSAASSPYAPRARVLSNATSLGKESGASSSLLDFAEPPKHHFSTPLPHDLSSSGPGPGAEIDKQISVSDDESFFLAPTAKSDLVHLHQSVNINNISNQQPKQQLRVPAQQEKNASAILKEEPVIIEEEEEKEEDDDDDDDDDFFLSGPRSKKKEEKKEKATLSFTRLRKSSSDDLIQLSDPDKSSDMPFLGYVNERSPSFALTKILEEKEPAALPSRHQKKPDPILPVRQENEKKPERKKRSSPRLNAVNVFPPTAVTEDIRRKENGVVDSNASTYSVVSVNTPRGVWRASAAALRNAVFGQCADITTWLNTTLVWFHDPAMALKLAKKVENALDTAIPVQSIAEANGKLRRPQLFPPATTLVLLDFQCELVYFDKLLQSQESRKLVFKEPRQKETAKIKRLDVWKCVLQPTHELNLYPNSQKKLQQQQTHNNYPRNTPSFPAHGGISNTVEIQVPLSTSKRTTLRSWSTDYEALALIAQSAAHAITRVSRYTPETLNVRLVCCVGRVSLSSDSMPPSFLSPEYCLSPAEAAVVCESNVVVPGFTEAVYFNYSQENISNLIRKIASAFRNTILVKTKTQGPCEDENQVVYKIGLVGRQGKVEQHYVTKTTVEAVRAIEDPLAVSVRARAAHKSSVALAATVYSKNPIFPEKSAALQSLIKAFEKSGKSDLLVDDATLGRVIAQKGTLETWEFESKGSAESPWVLDYKTRLNVWTPCRPPGDVLLASGDRVKASPALPLLSASIICEVDLANAQNGKVPRMSDLVRASEELFERAETVAKFLETFGSSS